MIVGTDLGATFSLISYINSAGPPTLIPARRDARRVQTPSVVHVGERGAEIGYDGAGRVTVTGTDGLLDGNADRRRHLRPQYAIARRFEANDRHVVDHIIPESQP